MCIFFLWSLANSQQTCRHPGLIVSPLRSASPSFTQLFFYLPPRLFSPLILKCTHFSIIFVAAVARWRMNAVTFSLILPQQNNPLCAKVFSLFLPLSFPFECVASRQPLGRSSLRATLAGDIDLHLTRVFPRLLWTNFLFMSRIAFRKVCLLGFFWFTHRWNIRSVFSPVLFIHLFLFKNVQITDDLLFQGVSLRAIFVFGKQCNHI